ncbi:peroxide stress protein YaaA [Rhodobacteraceae bacterium CCMM004]|nr:peroxide stress protein YaaA [Rhodobacteraceae bacterium CCMM004]
MLIVISPAKRLRWDVPVDGATRPEWQREANILAGHVRQLPLKGLKALMDLSDDLARLNRDRFRDMTPESTAENSRPAALCFDGDTYQGLDAGSLDDEAMNWAQERLRILSGLYGLLRPRDAIQPYRLEMGSRLKTRRGRSLYEFWGSVPAEALRRQAETLGTDVLLNCASQEYFGAVDPTALGLRVITPQFLEDKPGGPRMVSFFAKRARGAMARFVIDRRLTDPAGLSDFDLGGYRYDAARSEPDRPVFVRAAEAGEAADAGDAAA